MVLREAIQSELENALSVLHLFRAGHRNLIRFHALARGFPSYCEDPCDRRKLELLTEPRGHYQYQLGLYINVDGGNFTCT